MRGIIKRCKKKGFSLVSTRVRGTDRYGAEVTSIGENIPKKYEKTKQFYDLKKANKYIRKQKC